MKNLKKILLLAGFVFFADHMPIQASETQSYIEKLYTSFAPRSANHFLKLTLPTVYCIEAISIGGIALYSKLTGVKHSTSTNIALGIGALIAASTIAAKIATSTCNPIIDSMHKNKTDDIRKKMLADGKFYTPIANIANCFIKHSDGSISYYMYTLYLENTYNISGYLNEEQKNKVAQILQAKGLPISLIEKIGIIKKENDILKNLQVMISQEKSVPLEDILKKNQAKLLSANGCYAHEEDRIYIDSQLFIDDRLDAVLTHVLLHEITHHYYSLGRQYFVDTLWPFTKYIIPIIEIQQPSYAEEYRADLKSLELMNCTNCIKKLSTLNKSEINAIYHGYVAQDPEFIRRFIAHHPNMPETCTLCCDQHKQYLKKGKL